jgi:hypothetical protein
MKDIATALEIVYPGEYVLKRMPEDANSDATIYATEMTCSLDCNLKLRLFQ